MGSAPIGRGPGAGWARVGRGFGGGRAGGRALGGGGWGRADRVAIAANGYVYKDYACGYDYAYDCGGDCGYDYEYACIAARCVALHCITV